VSDAAAQSRVLEVAALSARYGHVEALQPVDLFVGGGELVAVLGPNGAGKSTLMRAVMGLVATQGAVRFRGNAVPRNPVGAAAMGLVLVPEGRGIFGPMSVAENLELGAYLLNDKAELAHYSTATTDIHSVNAFSDTITLAIAHAAIFIQVVFANSPIFTLSLVNRMSGKTAKLNCRLKMT